MIPDPKTRVLLLVEDNAADADYVTEMLAENGGEHYHVLHVPSLADATETLRSVDVDVVVLDLRLPDCEGIEGVRTVRNLARNVPIVVLTGAEDDVLALACIDAGAQDYLRKSEVRAQNLRRAIGYAITRIREAQLRELKRMLDEYRALSSDGQSTTVTAALAGSGAVSMRSPETFGRVVDAYFALVAPFLERDVDRIVAPRRDKEMLITALGDADGGPRDLLDVHVAALDRAAGGGDGPRYHALVFEARLLALEMMGLLVDYYRVGHRRRFLEGVRS